MAMEFITRTYILRGKHTKGESICKTKVFREQDIFKKLSTCICTQSKIKLISIQTFTSSLPHAASLSLFLIEELQTTLTSPSPRPPTPLSNIPDRPRRLPHLIFDIPRPINHLIFHLAHGISRPPQAILRLLFPMQHYLFQFLLQVCNLSRFVVDLFGCLEFQPCVVGELVGEEGEEESFECWAAEGFVVCSLFGG